MPDPRDNLKPGTLHRRRTMTSVSAEPIARGVIVPLAAEHGETLAILSREMVSILRAFRGEARVAAAVPPDADFVLVLVEGEAEPSTLQLPDLKDRVGSSVAFADRAAEGRAANARARKHLRRQGAALGPRELVFSPKDLGYMGLEDEQMRERLEELLQTLVLDAERFRLKREGWEEPDE